MNVRFCPTDAINYYRRIYCLVEHQDVISLDLLGTCYNDKRRPATFKPHHVANYHSRVINGLAEYGPEQLEEMLKDGTIVHHDGILSYPDDSIAQKKGKISLMLAVTFNYDFPYSSAKVASQYFYENVGENLACSLLDTYVDFGPCSRYRVIEPQTIRVRNDTWGRMSCIWMHPGESWGQSCPFSVSPRTADISPKSVTEFKVSFRPTAENAFFGFQIECYVYFKSMRNFRLVNEETFTPPWCLTPTVAGNTFPPGKETFIPKVDFSRSRFDFPACHVDRSVYHPVLVTNSGDTSIKFSFNEIGGTTKANESLVPLSQAGNRQTMAIFSIKPSVGVLQKNESKLILMRFAPSDQRIYDEIATCYFNSSEANNFILNMYGYGYYPRISFDPILQFKPTSIGAVAGRFFTIKNNSKINVAFEWCIPKQYASVVSITPLSSILAPNATLELQCTFAPNIASNYNLKIPCYYYHEQDDQSSAARLGDEKKRATLSVFGKAINGKLSAKPELVDFGTILVNTIVEKEITILNPSECDIFYTIEVLRFVAGQTGSVIASSLKDSGLEVNQKSKVLPARSNETIRIKACAGTESEFEYRIFYKADTLAIAEAEGLVTPMYLTPNTERFLLSTVVLAGVHPIVSVTDIRKEGISKTILWHMFSLEAFNSILAMVKPPEAQPRLLIDEDSFAIEEPPFQNGSDVDFDFGADILGAKPTILHISLKNSGVVTVDWVFHFLNDDEIDMENWADPGEYSEEQLKQNFILDNNVFRVVPRAGNLAPGESVRLAMSYTHEFPGAHSLPVVFRLKNGSSNAGKELLINFAGYSIPPAQAFLHLEANYFTFKPIKIGTDLAPIQVLISYLRAIIS